MTGKRGRRKAVTKGKSPKKTDDVPPPTPSPQVEISPAPSPQKQRDESRGRAVRSKCKRRGSPWRFHGVPTASMEFSRRSRRVDEVFTALPRRPHGVPAALLLERRVMAFVLSMSKRNADPWRSRISHGVRWSSHRVATASMEFSWRSPWRSAFL